MTDDEWEAYNKRYSVDIEAFAALVRQRNEKEREQKQREKEQAILWEKELPRFIVATSHWLVRPFAFVVYRLNLRPFFRVIYGLNRVAYRVSRWMRKVADRMERTEDDA